jgi:uncharacterized protein (DUF342 family)
MGKRLGSAFRSANGTFKLNYQNGYAMLTVTPPTGGGRPVYASEVIGRMKMLRIPMVRKLIIDQIIERATGRPERLAEWPEGAKLSASLDIYISEDNMLATCVMHRPKKGGGSLSEEDVLEELRARGVVFGFQRENIRNMIREPLYEQEIIVAEGQEPVMGSAQRVKFFFNTQPGKPYLMMEFGRIDLKELDFIQNRKAGDVLAEAVPAVTSRDGSTVTGEVLPSHMEGSVQTLKGGKNTELSDEEDKIIALEDGNACIRRGAVCIEPVVTLENVDYSTGNIRFEGSAVVNGTIADGFTVETEGSLQVDKFVGKVKLKAGQAIVLRGGLNGAGECSVECEGDIFARYIENARVRCGGNLIVEEAIMHSELSVGGNVLLTGKRAELIAGRSIIGGSLWCKKLGNVSEIKTAIRLGIEPVKLELAARLKQTIGERREALNALDAKLTHLTERIKSRKRVAQEEAEELKQLNADVQRLVHELKRLKTQRNKLRSALESDVDCMLVVEDVMFHGVFLVFGHTEYSVPLKGVRKTIFKMRDDRIAESGYNPYDPPKLVFKR